MKSGVAGGGLWPSLVLFMIAIFLLSAKPIDRRVIYWEGRVRSQLKSVSENKVGLKMPHSFPLWSPK